MKRLRRTLVPAGFSFLILLSLAFNLNGIAQQTPNESGQVARPDADSMVLKVTVTDKRGLFVDSLDKTAFALYDDKIPQEITSFVATDEPLSVGIILDLSGSLTSGGSKKNNAIRNAVLHFIEASRSDNHYFVVPFAGRARLLIDWTRDGKTAAEEFSKYNFLPRRGNTALYDACYLAIEKMQTSAHNRRVILLVTDGKDNNSQHSFKEIRERLKETGVMLYSIGIFAEDQLGSSLGTEGQATLEEFSNVSGGMAFYPKNAQQVDEVFERIALELRHQYLIGFKPAKDKADDKWHQLKIKVTPPPTPTGETLNLFARTRVGYYANQD
jgi:Ca-activated chloride channel family protein